jgi:hypothetical protein
VCIVTFGYSFVEVNSFLLHSTDKVCDVIMLTT